MQQHQRDVYVRQAQVESCRSRAVYKLQQIDQRDKLLHANQYVVDLGATPGGWSQYANQKVSMNGCVIAIDLLPMQPLHDVFFLQGDFQQPSILEQCLEHTKHQKMDVVISDAAPNITGCRDVDQQGVIDLVTDVLQFSCNILKPNGDMLVKVFEGEGIQELKLIIKQHFKQVVARKPKASRSQSREYYILARGYQV